RVGLAADADLRPLELDAEAEGGVVTVTGRAPLRKNNRTGNRIVEIARSVPGVESVRLKVEWYDPYP
ncbi:MAG: BON domain-containing protein, partial [Anaerolineae bacterium]